MRSHDVVAVAALGVAALLVPEARAETKKFALSVLHFNVQYVAGGLFGFFSTPDPVIDLTAVEVEDQIVVESFEPVLDMFLGHPTWGANIELQGYMLDVMAERHSGVLDKLRALATSGQIEVTSFHYSDQLFLAYPREDWLRSAALNDATFAKHGIPRGTSVFCQEGQAGPGLAGAMAERGYETLVYPKNLFGFQLGEEHEVLPLYRWGDVRMVTSRGFSWTDGTDEIQVEWWFVDDGELLATGDFDPYLPEQFKHDPAAIAEAEANLAALEAAGFDVATVAEYAAAVKAIVEPAEPPPLLEGTWQPGSTDGIHRWLGGYGLWGVDERDNDVRTLGAIAHRELVAAETIAEHAGLDARADLDGAWRLLVLGQVTDATGINPFRGEIEYGLAHLAESLRLAREVIDRGSDTIGGGPTTIDTATGAVSSEPSNEDALVSAAPALAIEIFPGDRPVEERWSRVAEGHHIVEVSFASGEERTISAVFPGTDGPITFTPGLAEAPISLPRDAFVFDHFDLALSDGLIGLGGDVWVIKDQAFVHLGASVKPTTPDVTFHDDTAPAGEAVRWVFHVVEGPESAALEVARRTNVVPRLVR